ncbi:hypothetical protein D1AOALGA4SA_10459 [Olavius algarvensis Delta 1 endosymbiont]|nr:hypothetical protein D1AOALGA4SA_10459 [Olavius algarvensis Delta 1 endosymbiont]
MIRLAVLLARGSALAKLHKKEGFRCQQIADAKAASSLRTGLRHLY